MNIVSHGKTEDGKKYYFEFEVPAADFAAAVDSAYKKNVSKINIPGFRNGHAPQRIIEKMYGDSFFFEDAIDDMLPDMYGKCLDSVEISVIDRPEVNIESADKEKGVKGKFTVLLRPELSVKEYKGLEAKKEVAEVGDEQVDKQIEQLQLKGSRLVPVEDRAAQNDDTATFDFEGFVDDKAFDGGKAENYTLVLGSHQFIPGFEEQMVGHSAGEEFEVNVRFPEDYNAEELKGKDATFKIKLHELRMREMPKLDDEFAKDVSEFDTLEELRADIKKHLVEDAEADASEKFENELMDKVSAGLEGEVPEIMIEQRIDENIRDFEYRLNSQGLDLAKYLKYLGQSKEDFRNGFKEQAEKQVKVRLSLEAVARAEKFEITDEDVDKEYQRIADEYKMELDKVKSLIDKADMKMDLAANRALDLIRDSAKVQA